VNKELLDRILSAEIDKAENDQARARQDITSLEARIALCQKQIEQNTQLLETKQAEVEELKELRSELTDKDPKDKEEKN
jgi:uncharacterized protein HemX